MGRRGRRVVTVSVALHPELRDWLNAEGRGNRSALVARLIEAARAGEDFWEARVRGLVERILAERGAGPVADSPLADPAGAPGLRQECLRHLDVLLNR